MKRGTLFLRYVGTTLLCIMILMFFTRPVQAKNTSDVLKVAFYPLQGFFEYDSNGNEIGYGVELLDKVSQYTGIKFEYIRAKSWEDTKRMLLDGEADLRMPATMPSNLSSTLSYSSVGIMDTYNVMLTLNSREELYYQDYDTIKTLKIAVSENFYKVNDVKTYLDFIGVTEEQLIFCSGFNECRERLEAGEVDALLTNVMDMDETMKMLVRFNSVSNYFSMTLNNAYLDTLDEAMAKIKLDEPLFLSDLYAKWFPDRTTIPLNIEESEYLASIDCITFAFQPKEGYLSRYEDGVYYGIYTEIAKCICEKLGVAYQAVSILDCQNKKAVADVYAGFFYDQNYAEELGLSLSAPLNDINYYMIKKKEETFNPATCRIAAVEKFRYTSEYVEKQYRYASFLYFDTYEECLQAVASGDADMTIINNYIAEYYLGMYQFNDLSVSLLTDYSHLFCFATEEDNEMLCSIITKAISMISEEEMNQLYILGQEQKPESNYILAAIYNSPIQFVLIVTMILVILLGFLMMLLFVQKNKKKNQQLASALSAKSDFLARMSHDMRTPMNGILGLSYLMEESDDVGQVKSYIPKLRESGEYLLQLINDVLDVNKIESGKLTLHIAKYSEKKLFDSIIDLVEPLIKEKNIEFHFEKIDIEWKYMILDEQRVKQIFVNLLGNAIKFTPNGGRIDFIMESVSQNEMMIRDKFIIRDNGIGISKEFLPEIFEPFCQEERLQMDVRSGTGLGLPIVKQLVELMNGTITIESEENKGTQVTLYLEFPLAECPKESSPLPEEEEALKNSKESLKGCKILLCEDHPLNAKIVIKLLELQGVEVTWCENGKIGVETFAESEIGYFDAILMDIRMPVMNGLVAAKEIRDLERQDAKQIPIIALTANAYDTDIQQSLEAGMNAHLAKPVEPKKLFRTLIEFK